MAAPSPSASTTAARSRMGGSSTCPAAQLLGFYQNGTAKVRVEIMEEESRAVAAAAGRPDSTAGKPQAAPASTVVAEALPGSAPPEAAPPNPTAVSAVGLAAAAPEI